MPPVPVKKAVKVTGVLPIVRVLPMVSIPAMEVTVKTPDEEIDPVASLLPMRSVVESTAPWPEGKVTE